MNNTKYPYRGEGKSSLIDSIDQFEPHELKTLFKGMLRIRLIEEAVADRYQDDEMKTPIHLAIGQEAVAVGSCALLRKKDFVYCGHRSHAVYLAKGGDLNAMFSEFHCRINGCCGSRGGSMHLLDKKVGMGGSSAIVAGIIPIATGAALAAKLRGDDSVVVVYLGDAAVEEGACWESINFAKLKELPILYVCENNYFSVCTPIESRQPKGVEIYKKAEAFGLKSVAIDGNDVLKVHQTSQEMIQWIKDGKGPAFIEAHTYRWRGHHGSGEDSHLGHRSEKELADWKNVDPIAMMQDILMEKSYLSQEEYDQMAQTIHSEIEAGFEHALSSPFPTEEDLLTHVYARSD